MSLILRHRYTCGYVSLSELYHRHAELKFWEYHQLRTIAMHSIHRNSKRFDWLQGANGEFAIKIPDHLRVSRRTQRELDDCSRAAKRRPH